MAVSDYDPIIDEAAREWDVDPIWVRSVMHQESGGNAVGASGRPITSTAGAVGLMQLMPNTWKGLGVADPTDPVQNIWGGVKYLAQMRDQFKGNIPLATAAFNAGPERVNAYIANKTPLPAETVAPVQQVSSPDVPSDEDFLKQTAGHVTTQAPQTPSIPSDEDFLKQVGATPKPIAPTTVTPAGPDYTGWDRPTPTALAEKNYATFRPSIAADNGALSYNALTADLAPAPNTTYGELLPFARDNTTGAVRLAMPGAVRSLAQGGLDLLHGPATGTVTPEGTNALATVAGGMMPSPASAVARTMPGANALRPPPPEAPLLSQEFRAAPGATEPSFVPQVTGPTEPNPLVAPSSNGLSIAPSTGSVPAVAQTATVIPRTAAEAKAVASAYYTKADAAGGELSPSFVNRFIDNVESAAPQTEAGKVIAGESPITTLVDRIQTLRDQPISLHGAQEVDESLGNLIDKEYGPRGLTKDGKNLLDLQTTFRDMIRSAGPSEVGGGATGFDALNQARAAWAQAMKMADLERIQARAELTDNPATSIKSGIRVLLSNPTRARGYSPAEISALQAAGERGVLGGALHVFGSRLVPLAAAGATFGASGFLPALGAAGVMHVGSSLMRRGATAIQTKRMNNALSTLGSSVPPPPSP